MRGDGGMLCWLGAKLRSIGGLLDLRVGDDLVVSASRRSMVGEVGCEIGAKVQYVSPSDFCQSSITLKYNFAGVGTSRVALDRC